MGPERYSHNPDNELSSEQIAALEAGPGRVTNPAGPFLTPASELEHLNNFAMYFDTSPNSFIPALYRNLPHRQRFGIVHPDLTAQLETEVANGYKTVADFSFMKTATGRLFAEAYDLMRQQVDMSDPHVVIDSEVNRFLLWG